MDFVICNAYNNFKAILIFITLHIFFSVATSLNKIILLSFSKFKLKIKRLSWMPIIKSNTSNNIPYGVKVIFRVINFNFFFASHKATEKKNFYWSSLTPPAGVRFIVLLLFAVWVRCGAARVWIKKTDTRNRSWAGLVYCLFAY